MEFGSDYAAAYDALYGDKDYEAETDILEQLFGRYASGSVHDVLDLGCGTGSHALPLARRGYAVTGVDVAPEMLSRARAKVATADLRVALSEADIREYRDGRQYDAVIMMFAVLGYQRTNDDVTGALRTASEHLRPGGVFVADFWYGPAVLTAGPESRFKTVVQGERRILRFASGLCDEARHTCTVSYDTVTIEGTTVLGEVHEDHNMRFFFPLELDFALNDAGLERSALTAYPEVDRPPGVKDWCVCLVARRSGTTPAGA